MNRSGPALVGIALPDDPAVWRDAGFTVEDDEVVLGPVSMRLGAGAGAPGLVFDRSHPDGAPSFAGIPWTHSSVARAPVAAHANGIDDVDHVVIMAPDGRAMRRAIDAAGFEIRRERPATIAGRSMVQLFVWAGDALLEIVTAAGPPAEAASESSSSAASVWGIAVTAPDLDATAAWFGDRAGAPREAVQAGRRISTVRRDAVGCSIEIAVMSARPK